MYWLFTNRKCVVFCFLSVVFVVVTAFGQTKSDNIGEIVKRLDHPPEPTGRFGGRSMAAYYDRKADEAYEKRNAEITPWVEDGAPPNFGNAALLYYQAFLLRPEPNQTFNGKFYSGAEPDRQVRTYLGHCLPVIEIAEIASRMPQCIWGVWTERRLRVRDFMTDVGDLQTILLMDARTLAADGHYRVALERCLTVLRIARHFSEDPELYLLSVTSYHPLSTIQYVLGAMPPDADILTWLRGQLAIVQGAPPPYAKELQAFVKAELNNIRTRPDYLARLRNLLIEGAEDEQAKENARNLTDEQLLSRPREAYARFLDSIFRILDSEMTYEQKLDEMQRLVSKLTDADAADPVTKDILIMNNIGGMINLRYPYYVWHQAHINGVKVAVEVYLVVAKTGRLPETLPDYVPKDPSSGQDFAYEIMDDGFALHCQDEEFLSRYSQRLEFKVKK